MSSFDQGSDQEWIDALAGELGLSPDVPIIAGPGESAPASPPQAADHEPEAHTNGGATPTGLRRADEWKDWEAPNLKRLRVEGDGLDEIIVEEMPPPASFLAVLQARKEHIAGKYDNWHVMSPTMQHALIIIEEACGVIPQEWQSALFVTKLLTLITFSSMRSHEDGVYMLEGNAWVRTPQIPLVELEALEATTKMAAGILCAEMALFKQHFEAGTVTEGLRDFAQSPHAQEHANIGLLEQAGVVNRRDRAGDWVTGTILSLLDILPKWSRNVHAITENYARWAFQPRPKHCGFVAMDDCILRFSEEGVQQIRRADARDVYVRINTRIQYRPSDDYLEFFQKFMTTCIAGNSDALDLECAIESLALRGRVLPHHIIIYYGQGGNSKGARSNLRAKVFGSGHAWVSPSVFDTKLRDEFRKQGHEFVGAMFCTIREADAFDLDEKVFKCWTAGEGVQCRLPFAVHTPSLFWPCTGKFWEMNLKATPRIRSVQEASFTRRLLAIEKKATFTSDLSKVDPDKLIFEADGCIEEKLDSGDAIWCYLRTVLLPWQRSHSEADAREIIMRPAPSIQRDTERLLDTIRKNQESTPFDKTTTSAPVVGCQGLPEVGEDNHSANESATMRADPSFILLLESHKSWACKSVVKDYMVLQATWIPGGRFRGQKKKARSETFDECLSSKYNFFFDHHNATDYVRSSFSNSEIVLDLPAQIFGSPDEWLPFPKVANMKADERKGFSFDEVANVEQNPDPTQPDLVVFVEEIGHLANLRDYQAMNVDRRPSQLQAWIARLAEGTPLAGGDYYQVSVAYKQCHNIPGRFVAVGPSLQNITKEARAVSVADVCVDFDFPLSHPTSLHRMLQDLGIADEYPVLTKYINHYKEWRARWGKVTLNTMLYGGVPLGDAWNPATWTLAFEVRRAAHAVLSTPQWSYLLEMFHDRPKPLYTRLYYAISAHENMRLQKVTETASQCVRALLFDGFIVDSEVANDIPVDRLDGAIPKPWVRHDTNMFMLIRGGSELATDPVEKLPNIRKACIINAILNVAPVRVSTLVRNRYSTHGPSAYADIQRFLISCKSAWHLDLASVEQIANASEGDTFLLHHSEHAIGLVVLPDGRLSVADDSYDTKVTISIADLVQIINSMPRWSDEDVVVWSLTSGQYMPEQWPTEFFLMAGGVSRATKKHILKKPAAGGHMDVVQNKAVLQLKSIFSDCPQCGKGSLYPRDARGGILIGFHSQRTFKFMAQRCNRKGCRANVTHHYMTTDRKRTNLAKISDLTDGVLLVRTGVAFDLDYVRYHAGLHFRAYVSARSVAWVHGDSFGESEAPDAFRHDLLLAIVLFRAMSELGDLGLERHIHLLRPSCRHQVHIDTEAMAVYRDNLHHEVFVGGRANDVTEISIDGHEKVTMKGCAMVRKRVGRPSSRSSKETRENGWVMAVDPRTQRVLGVKPMDAPENNTMIKDLLSEVIPCYPKVDCIIYDRMCRFHNNLAKDPAFKQIKFFCTDRFHGRKHHSSCPCSPSFNRRLDRRLRGVNTSASEQVFSWFRNYARNLNMVSANTHFFLVLVYCKLHNSVLDQAKNETHLPPASLVMKRPSRAYSCRP